MTRATAEQFDVALAHVVIPAKAQPDTGGHDIDLDLPANVAHAIEIAKDLPPSVQGESGDTGAFIGACRVFELGIELETGRAIMHEHHGPNCQPYDAAWLDVKIDSAWKTMQNKKGSKSAVADFANDPVEPFEAMPPEPDPDYPQPINAKDLAAKEFPKRVDVVDGLIIPGIVQTIDGDGGVGKSTIMVQMAVAVAAGKPIFERDTSQRPVWFITHEDDEQDLQPVMMAMAAELDVNLADLPLEISSLLDFDIAIADIDDNGKAKELPFYRYLDKMLATRRGSLVILDCLADIAQMQEAGRLAPNAFFKKVMTGLCKRHDVGIMILAHPSKAAMVSGAWYSGGTGYKTAVRHKLVMKLVDPKDIYGPRTLETLKKNWGKRSPPITLSWQRGIFILDQDGTSGRMKYRIVVGKILEMIEAGKRVARSNQADCDTPKTLAEDLLDPEGAKLTTAKEVAALMRKAEAEGVLKYVEGQGKDKARYVRGDNAGDFDTQDDNDDDADASID